MKRWKVLIADDEEVILEGLQLLYAWDKNGMTIAGTAQDGQEALEVAASVQPHIVLMDINMPRCNGLETIKKMKRILPDAQFIIISGYSEFQYAQQALRLGVLDYLLKPVSAETLSASLFNARQQLEKMPESPAGGSERVIDLMINFIEENLDKNLSLGDVAAHFHMSPGYISQFFKKKTQKTFSYFCISRKLERAQILLSTTDKNISEISEALGFASYRTFSKQFKQYTGVPPSKYKR